MFVQYSLKKMYTKSNADSLSPVWYDLKLKLNFKNFMTT